MLLLVLLLRAAFRKSPGKSYPFSEIERDPNFEHVRTIHTKIRGVSFRQGVIRRACHEGDALCLIREANNPVDRNAIAILRIVEKGNTRARGEQLGYVSRELAEDLAPELDSGAFMLAKITALTGGGAKRTIGVNIEIEEYRPIGAKQSMHRASGTQR